MKKKKKIVWLHEKSGYFYEIVCFGYREADLVPLVVYRNTGGGDNWVRPLAEFMDGRFTQVTK